MYTRMDLLENKKIEKIIKENHKKEYLKTIKKEDSNIKSYIGLTVVCIVIPILVGIVEKINF